MRGPPTSSPVAAAALLALALALTALTSCTTVGENVRRTGLQASTAANPPARKLLVVMPDSPAALEVLSSLQVELKQEFELISYFENGKGTPAALLTAVDEVKPDAVVLMDNVSVHLFRLVQAKRKDATPPAVATLASFLPEELRGMPRVTGIAYEVPIVTQLVRLRLVSPKPITKIGLVYRPALGQYVQQQAELVKLERAELVTAQVSSTPTAAEVRTALDVLRRQGAQALVLINDNALLNRSLLAEVWLPEVAQAKLPVLVGVRGLLDRGVGFGTMGLLPDHTALGSQLSSLILDLADERWENVGRPVQMPVAVKSLIDAKSAAQTLGSTEEMMQQFDEVLR